MGDKRLPRSLRKYIRQEKARIRREVLDLKKQQEIIQKLYERFSKKAPAGPVAIKAEKKSSSNPVVASKNQ